MFKSYGKIFPVVFAIIFSLTSVGATAQGRLITGPIDESVRRTVAHSTHRLAVPANDAGPVAPDAKMERLLLILGRAPEQEQALREFLDSQQDKTSPNYHHWLTAAEFAQKYGPPLEDVQQVQAWLSKQGFVVTAVAGSRQWIEFAGTAAQAGRAFQTEMRNYQAAGGLHVANASDISIPASLAPAVRGVLSLHNFFSAPMLTRQYQVRRDDTGAWEKANPDGTFTGANGSFHVLAPGDYARIYNLSPLYQSGLDGSGQTVAIVARSSIRLIDTREFRRIFNLPANDPNIIFNGPEAGFLNFGDEIEADLDMQWAGSVAPKASIDLVISASTLTTDGVDLSAAYIVDNNLAPVMSVSFGLCEQNLGPIQNAFYNSLWQQAAAQGMTVLVSSGDNGAAGCDDPGDPTNTVAHGGLAVNGLASTPFNTAVGGTQFRENNNDSAFWNSTNSTGSVSAKGYIPEGVWNESCDPTAIGSPCATQGSLFAGSGGASTLYAKPSWQTGLGVPADGKRDLPDVSLAAAGGHDGYIVCFIGSCQTRPDANGVPVLIGATIVGGTSASSPAFAGIMALVNQKTGTRQGQANYILYRLAGNQGAAGCDSSGLTDPASPSPCVFYDITAGNNTVPGRTGFAALPGFDLATGLGSVNAGNLVNAWNSANFQGSATALSTGATAVQHGQPVPITVTVQASSGTGTPSGNFALLTDKFGPAGVGPLTNGSFSGSFATLPGGQYNLTAHYQGDSVFGSSDSAPISLNITPENANLALSSLEFGPLGPFQTTNMGYGDFLFFRVQATSASGNGTPTGTVTFKDGTTTLGTISLSGKGEGEFSNNCFGPFFGIAPVVCLEPGVHPVTAIYSGDNSFNGVTSTGLSINVGKSTPTIILLQPSQTSLVSTQQLSLLALVSNSGPILPTGTVQFFEAGTPVGPPMTIAPATPGSRPQALFQSALSPGTHVFTVSYSGDNVYQPSSNMFPGPATITVTAPGGVATQTTLAPSITNPSVGQVVNYTATIHSTQSTPALGGTVELLGDFGPLTAPVPVSNGVAVIPFSWFLAGSQFVIAQYSGDATFAPSGSALVTVDVSKISPIMTLGASSTLLQSGQQVTLSATAGSPVSLTVSASGLIQFFDSFNGGPAQPIGSAHFTGLGDGFARIFSLPLVLQDGTHVITAQYQEDSAFLTANSNPVTITVAPPSFQMTASSPALTIVAGQSGSVTVTITPAAGLNTTATLSCGSGVPAGAICSISPSSVPLNGSPVTALLTISTTAPSSAAAFARSTGVPNLWWTFIAAVACVLVSARKPKYRRQLLSVILIGGLALNISCGGGNASGGPPPPPPPPTPTPTPTGAVPSSTTLASSAAKSVNGNPVTLTATISSAATPITGTVAFMDGSSQIGVAPVNAGQAKLQILSLGLGTHSITAKYSGDARNLASNSATLQQAIIGTQQLQVTASAGGQAQTMAVKITLQ